MNLELTGVDPADVPTVTKLADSCARTDSVASFLEALRGELLRCGFMIGDVRVDGEMIDSSGEPDFEDLPVKRVERVDVEVSPANVYVGETFEECVRATARLGRLKDEITESVRAGKVADVAADLATFTDGLAALIDAYQDGISLLSRIGLAGIDDIERSQAKMSALGGVLRDILDGVDLEDFVLVSDALEHEFPEHLDVLSSEFGFWSEQMKRVNGLPALERPGGARRVSEMRSARKYEAESG